jgi:hypothetical protein
MMITVFVIWRQALEYSQKKVKMTHNYSENHNIDEKLILDTSYACRLTSYRFQYFQNVICTECII